MKYYWVWNGVLKAEPREEEVMKKSLYSLVLVSSLVFLGACSKEYMGPLDETGSPVHTKAASTDGPTITTGGDSGGITDGGHDSDYDTTNKNKRKQQSPGTPPGN